MFRPPAPFNEPVRAYTAGSPERAELEARLQEMQSERMEIPCVIGGKDVRTGTTFESVMPHRKEHVLADVHQGGAEEVRAAIAAAAKAWPEWSRTPWEERVAVFLRAAELLAGPWRQTLNAATMLNQSKTAHQAEIDAACELIDFWRFNVRLPRPHLRGAAGVVARRLEPHGVPAARGLRLRGQPVQLHGHRRQPHDVAGDDGQHRRLEAGVDGGRTPRTSSCSCSRRRGCRDGVINLVYGPGAGSAMLRSPARTSPASTSRARPPVFQDMWRTVGGNIERYRSYPRIVGETGGKDFIVAHPSADADAVATAVRPRLLRVPGPEVLGRVAHLHPRVALGRRRATASRTRSARSRMGDVDGLPELHGRRHRRQRVREHREAIEEARAQRRGRSSPAAPPTTARASSSSRRSSRRPIRTIRLLREELFGPIVTAFVYPDSKWHDTLAARRRDVAVRADGRGVRARPRRASRTQARRCGTRPATSTSTTSRPARSSASSRSAARGRRARTTRPARCGTSSAGSARGRSRRRSSRRRDYRYPFLEP